MPRRVLAAAFALLVASTGLSPCAAAAIAHAPARASAHGTTTEESAGAGSRHEPSTSIVARCACHCVSDVPRSVVSSRVPTGAVPAALAALPTAATAAAAGEPSERTPNAPHASIEHVPIAS